MQQMLGDFLAQDPLGGQEKQREKERKKSCVWTVKMWKKAKEANVLLPFLSNQKESLSSIPFIYIILIPFLLLKKKAINVTNTAFLFLNKQW